MEILPKSRWKVREGNISLWYDNFLSVGPLFELDIEVEDPNIRLKELVANDRWEVERLQRLMGRQVAHEVIELIGSLKNLKDILVWLPEKSENFSTKSAWEAVRVRRPIFEWAKWVWHKLLPKKIAICMWRAVFNCLSVEEQIHKIGIPLISGCNCCKERQ